MKLFYSLSLIFLLVLLVVFLFTTNKGDIPFIDHFSTKSMKWSIGIYKGNSLFNLSPHSSADNPVLTKKDITDVPADFVADPFMVMENNSWYLFIEVLNANTKKRDIGLAMSQDGIHWHYKQIVLSESFHLSYPYVFRWKDAYYMIPETSQKHSIRLYRASDFPIKWSYVTTLVEGRPFVDSSIVFFNDKWWIFTSSTSQDILWLYYSSALEGPWIEHPQSPIIKNNDNIARPAGRIIFMNHSLVRFAQNSYGMYVRAFMINELTTTRYEESEISQTPIIGYTGFGWNGGGMPHIDAHEVAKDKWIACVDGIGKQLIFGQKFYRIIRPLPWKVN